MTGYSKTTQEFLRHACETYHQDPFEVLDVPLMYRKQIGSMLSAGFFQKKGGRLFLSKEGISYAKRFFGYSIPIQKPVNISYAGIGRIWFRVYLDEIKTALKEVKTSKVTTIQLDRIIQTTPDLYPFLSQKTSTIRRKHITGVLRSVPWSEQITRTPCPEWKIDKEAMNQWEYPWDQ